MKYQEQKLHITFPQVVFGNYRTTNRLGPDSFRHDHLCFVQVLVQRTGATELVVCALGHYLSIVHDDYGICGDHGAEPVCDNKTGSVPHQFR